MMMNGMGWLPDLPDFRDFPLSSIEQPLKALPTKVSGLTRSMPVYNQGSLGSCVANAVSRIFRFVDIKQGGGTDVNPSRLQIYYDARKLHGWEGWDSGVFIRDGMSVVHSIGTAPEEDWPYDIAKFTVQPPQGIYTEALQHQTLAYFRLDQTASAIENCIASGYPLVLGATLYDNFAPDGNFVIPMPSGSVIGGHAFVADGYDRSSQIIECANSWGPEWGQNGWFFMRYDYILDSDLASDLWTIRSVEEGFTPPPPPPPPIPTNLVKFDGIVKKANSNKIVIEPNEPLLINIAGRQIRATFPDGEFTGKCKTMEQNWIVIKPTSFNMTWDLVGDSIHVETI